MSKLVLRVDQEKLNKIVEKSIDNFKQMESDVLFDVDLEKCMQDYINAVFIYHTELFELIVL